MNSSERVYIVVRKPEDRLRALQVLHARCILLGLAWWDKKAEEIRSIVGVPSGFPGQAGIGLSSVMTPNRTIVIRPGEALDTLDALPDLTTKERDQVERLEQALRPPKT